MAKNKSEDVSVDSRTCRSKSGILSWLLGIFSIFINILLPKNLRIQKNRAEKAEASTKKAALGEQHESQNLEKPPGAKIELREKELKDANEEKSIAGAAAKKAPVGERPEKEKQLPQISSKELEEAEASTKKAALGEQHESQNLEKPPGAKIELREKELRSNNSILVAVSQEGKSVTIPQEWKLNEIPTGIPSFDPMIRGGVPSGSLVLLIGDAGAGNTAFAYTSASMLFLLKNDPAIRNSVRQIEVFLAKEEALKIPESVCYISFTHSKEDILGELEQAFPREFAKAWNGKRFFFKDFSSISSISPTWDIGKDWSGMKGIRDEGKLYLLKELISVLEFHAPNSLVIIDSLTELIRTSGLEWNDFISLLEDIQRKSKKWDGLMYLLLGRGMVENAKEEEIMDIADGVMVFGWAGEGFTRQQTMHMKKFRGLMPRMAKENIVRFDTSTTNTDGFVVTNVKRISGSR